MANRLAEATSPYLLQHRDNPVEWWEWSDEAFEEARRRDVPVLLSVGYAACHWCHVMAHESFADPATAEEMNRLYVNIKVDREERPDVDAVYMEAVQAMSGHGGWPMTVFIDHEGRPFFAGTYFPDVPRHGMPAFTEVLEAVSNAWEQRRDEVADQAERLHRAISGTLQPGEVPGRSTLVTAFAGMAASHDPVNGGFGGAPKFPQQPVLEFLLRARRHPWAEGADEMVTRTLEKMSAGGIHDHLGGGFARYAVDEHWQVPHFEKMLYDNAQLARIYLWAGIELERADFVAIARSTLDYLRRDLMHPEGAFFSSEDADSDGTEGKFYLWDEAEIRSLLGDEAGGVVEYYGVTPGGNFEGSNILHVGDRQAPPDLDRHRTILFEARKRRVRPGLDDKVVASWNGLAIRAFAEAGAALDDPELVEVAGKAARFATEHLMPEGRLVRSWREGRTSVPGFLDDHAALALGLFAVYAATGAVKWYLAATSLVGELERFARDDGGYYSTPSERSDLVKRPFDVTDNPLPSGNSMAAEALLLTSLYTGESMWRERAEGALAAAGRLVERYPTMVGHHLSVALSSRTARELALVGPGWRRLARVHWSGFRPDVALAPSDHGDHSIPLLAGRAVGDPAMAYLCRGFVCELPTSDPDTLADLLDSADY